MGQGGFFSGRAAAGKGAVCAFISILAGVDGLHTLFQARKRGASSQRLLRCTFRFAALQDFSRAAPQNDDLPDSVGESARHECGAVQQNCYFYRDSTPFFDSCVPTHVRSR